ncbi:12807_t:CDS:1, partial [Cetraspora pellucida]
YQQRLSATSVIQNSVDLTNELNNSDSDSDNLLSNNMDSRHSILRNIVDTETRWNSKFHSWRQLIKLRKAIEWLAAMLPLSDNRDDRIDGQKLNKWFLLPNEWDLLNQIVILLEPFDDATAYFSGSQYATLSVIYPLIQVLKYSFVDFEEI